MLLGLLGVGQTILLNRFAEQAEGLGYEHVQLEAPEVIPLASYLAPALQTILLRLDRVDQARAWAGEAMAALRGFASAFKASLGDVKIGLSEPARADSGNLEVDLPELLVATAQAAQAADTSVVVLIDEVHDLTEDELRGLIVALHRVVQRGLPLILFGACLPQLAALAYSNGANTPGTLRRTQESPWQMSTKPMIKPVLRLIGIFSGFTLIGHTPRERDDLHTMAKLGHGLKTPELGLTNEALRYNASLQRRW